MAPGAGPLARTPSFSASFGRTVAVETARIPLDDFLDGLDRVGFLPISFISR